MDILDRTKQLENIFSLQGKTELAGSNIDIIPFQFEQTFRKSEIREIQQKTPYAEFCDLSDSNIGENKTFNYWIFNPKGREKSEKSILLLHGLNERSWKKYLPWAEYLCLTTGKPIILFPIAFHMNRTPYFWNNPRMVLPWVNKRKEDIKEIQNSTFVNIALSSRLSQDPLRFYTSGRETIYNIWQLIHEMKEGKHPLFREDCSVNLFGYSIGAMLSEVLLLANPSNLFSKSKLFMFCGGSIFSKMNGNARDIMDSDANTRLQYFYQNDFIKEKGAESDFIQKAFKAIIRPDRLKKFRENFFEQEQSRIRAVSLAQDIVMTTNGIVSALGKSSGRILDELDFPYSYSHQWPFPLNTKTDKMLINASFQNVFNRAGSFL